MREGWTMGTPEDAPEGRRCLLKIKGTFRRNRAPSPRACSERRILRRWHTAIAEAPLGPFMRTGENHLPPHVRHRDHSFQSAARTSLSCGAGSRSFAKADGGY